MAPRPPVTDAAVHDADVVEETTPVLTARREAAPEPPAAPMPPVLIRSREETYEPQVTMEQVLRQAGAKQDSQGHWYREVPDTKLPKRTVVEGGKVYIETDYCRREVATGASWQEAVRVAQAAQGTHDAFVPGRGWLRNGVKFETEHPDNVGVTIGGPIGKSREEIPLDTAAAQQALALKNTLEAAAADARRRAAQEED